MMVHVLKTKFSSISILPNNQRGEKKRKKNIKN